MFELSQKIKSRIFGVILVGYIVLGVLLYQLPDNLFHVWFFDIGQGDSIFIKTPLNHQILIDGGPQNTVIERLDEVMPFFDKSLDLVVLTHPHADHVDGLVEVLARYEVENVLLTGVMDDYSGYEEFLNEISAQGVRAFIAEADVDFLFGGVLVDVVYPLESVFGESFENLNNSSVGVRVLYEGKAILLTGDLELEGEEELVLSGVDLETDIFKAGHHGSKTASNMELLRAAEPEVVVIQCGEDNSFGHPHEDALQRFAEIGVGQIYRNDLDGTVEFVF